MRALIPPPAGGRRMLMDMSNRDNLRWFGLVLACAAIAVSPVFSVLAGSLLLLGVVLIRAAGPQGSKTTQATKRATRP